MLGLSSLGVRALAAMDRRAEPIRYAEASRGLNDHPDTIARACEEILLFSGFADEAYERYALAANRSGSSLRPIERSCGNIRKRTRRGFYAT